MQSTPQNRGTWRERKPENPNRINSVTTVSLLLSMSLKLDCNKELEKGLSSVPWGHQSKTKVVARKLWETPQVYFSSQDSEGWSPGLLVTSSRKASQSRRKINQGKWWKVADLPGGWDLMNTGMGFPLTQRLRSKSKDLEIGGQISLRDSLKCGQKMGVSRQEEKMDLP